MVTLKECDLCVLGGNCKSVGISPSVPRQYDFMVVMDNPSFIDDRNGTIMENDKDGLIFKLLQEVIGADMNNIFFTYAVRCYKGTAKIGKKELEACKPYLLEEIEAVRPKAILTLGDAAMAMVTGVAGITKNRGNVYEVNGIPALPTFSPAYIDRQPEHLNKWAADVLKAYNLTKGVVAERQITDLVYITTLEEVKTLVDYCKQTKMAYFDFETTEIEDKGIFADGFYATMLSVSFQMGSGYGIPLFHKDSPISEDKCREILDYLRVELFENSEIRKAAHNLYYDASVLWHYGITLKGRIDDTMLMHHLIDETKRHGLKELVDEYFPEYSGYDDEVKNYKWAEVPLGILSKYAVTDTDLGLRLLVQLEQELMQDEPSYIIYRNLTMAAWTPLWEAHIRGMKIDKEFLKNAITDTKNMIRRQSARLKGHPTVVSYERYRSDSMKEAAIVELEEKLERWKSTHKNPTMTQDKMEQKLRDIKTGAITVYEGLSFGSPKQLNDILFDSPYGFEFKVIGKQGTGKDILDDLHDKSGFVDGLNVWRSLKKTLGTYLQGMLDRLDDNDYIHTTFKLQGTKSGRLSSANPNLQNMPNIYKLKHEDLIKATGYVKQSFVVPPNHKLFQLDYAQAELRVIAAFSRDENMMEVYRNNGDIHSLTAAKMLEVTLEVFLTLDKGVQKAARTRAKAVNFGLIYGMSAAGFREYARIQYGLVLSLQESIDTRNMFFETYPKLLDYHDDYIAKGRKFGWVRTLFGRRRRLPDINSNDNFKASMDERVAINSPIQGTAGEFTIFSIALLHRRMDPRVLFENTIHDSILFYIPDDLVESQLKLMQMTCENLPTQKYFQKELYGGIGMAVDAELTETNWHDMHEI